MGKQGIRRFTSEVHLGLLGIICILLLLNVVSNYVLYRARESVRRGVSDDLKTAALAIGRSLDEAAAFILPDSTIEQQKQRYRLSALTIIAAEPPDSSLESRRKWLALVVRNLPPGQVPDIARKLLTSEYRELTAGENQEYFYVCPVHYGAARSLVILSRNVPHLAFLDRSARLILAGSVVTFLSIATAYLILSRFILSPFRRLKRQAQEAGQDIDDSTDEAEALIDGYRRIIDDL
ncbi:MAG: hypothetical protein AB1744_15975, partial [Candidatus Zixiibacteriota bacterium]